jgi:allantoinase
MTSEKRYDLIIKNVRVVQPGSTSVRHEDIAISAGKIAAIAPALPVGDAKRVSDGRGRLAFPGLVDAHMHTGIYSPLAEDALTAA